MAVNLSRSSALLCAVNSVPSVAVPSLSSIVFLSGWKVVQVCSGKLRSGSLKSDLRCCAMVGEAAEEIKEDDGVRQYIRSKVLTEDSKSAIIIAREGDMRCLTSLLDSSVDDSVRKLTVHAVLLLVAASDLPQKYVFEEGACSEQERRSSGNAGSSRLSSVTALSPHGAKDLRDVVAEVRDDFEIASGYGKEVAMLLKAGKVPYQPSFLKVLSRILYLMAPWLTFMDSSSVLSVTFASRSVKLAKSYFEDVGKEFGAKFGSLSSTLNKLYAWEKRLYKEVKDEEKLRIMYENQRRRLKILYGVGAEFLGLVNSEIQLYNSMVDRDDTDGEEQAMKAYKAARYESKDDAEVPEENKVSSALVDKVEDMLQKLEKEIDDVDAKIGDQWRILDRDYDGKVTPEEVAAAAMYLKDTLGREGVQELISSLSKDADGKILVEDIVRLGSRVEGSNSADSEEM